MKNLIGISYEDANCFELVRRFYKQELGIELKSYFDGPVPERSDAAKLVYTSKGDFAEVKEGPRKFGDILLIKLYGIECHIAVYVGEGRMLHSTRGSGSVIDRTSKWDKMIAGTFRVLPENT